MTLEKKLLHVIDNSHNDAWLARQANVREAVINRYRTRKANIKNMTINTAEKILNAVKDRK